MMAQDSKAALRAKLSFEQQARFDALYDRQAKKQGPATALSMPVLGTFGLEQFYLGNVGSGIIRILFSWTLIPTVLALFEVVSGDLKRQVAHANARVAQRVYNEVIKNSPSLAAAPPAVRDSMITPTAVAEAAAFAAEVPIAPTMTDPGALALPFSPVDVANDAAATATPTPPPVAAPVVATAPTTDVPANTPPAAATAAPDSAEVTEMATEERQEDVAQTTAGAFTVTESAATWQQGMAAPVVASDEQTFTVGSDTDTVTDIGATTTAFVAETAAPASTASARQPDIDAEPLATAAPTADDAATAPLDEEGVLVFIADEEPLSADTFATATVTTPDVTMTETAAQHVAQQQQTDQVVIAEGEHVEAQHYHHGKLVEASRHDIKLTGEVNSLLTDTTTDTLLQEVETRSAHAPGWIDVSPLQSDDAATPSADAAAPPPPVADTTTPTSPTSDAAPAITTAADVATGTSNDVAHEVISVRNPDAPDGGNGSTADGSGTAPTSGTDVPSGGLGGPTTDVPSGGQTTDVPGGAVGGPASDTGTNVPSGGINSPTPDGAGDTGSAAAGDGSPHHRPTDGPIPS